MDHTHIVQASDLDRFAERIESQSVIPELLFHLVSLSSGSDSLCRIPYGDAVNQEGKDGLVQTEEGFLGYVPSGSSFWEIGVGRLPQGKATSDFKKRTKKIELAERQRTSFVFVTPRSSGTGGWNETKQSKWLSDRSSQGWKKIVIIDGVKLADWLRVYPALGRWLAKKAGIIPTLGGLFTPQEHWEIIAGKADAADPPLPPSIFTVGRENVCDALQSLFEGKAERLILFAESSQDVQDFVAAYLVSCESAVGNSYANRCLFVTEEDAWRSVVETRKSHVFVADPRLGLEAERADLQTLATRNGHAVVIPLCGDWAESNPEIIRLRSPSRQQIDTSLCEAGYTEIRARELAAIGGDQISALRRHLLGLGALPPYATWENARRLAEAGLFGGWNGKSSGDLNVLETLLGKAYGDWIEKLRPSVLRSDSPLIQQNEIWRIVGRGEAWDALGNRLNDEDLTRFQELAVTVLSDRDPQFDLPKDERYLASVHGKKLNYSSQLRKGIAETLALLGAKPEALSQCSTGTATTCAILVVRRVLENVSWERWAGLNSLLPLLAEAAPDEFLDAIESALEDLNNNLFHQLYQEEGGGFIGGGTHMSGVLWALESLAWSPSYLSRVSIILADLASIDPGGHYANRPANTLVDIFLPWHVQTTATFDKRKAAVESILREQPDVGWKLLQSLLPHSHGVTSGCHKPTWRQFIPRDWKTGVSNGEYWEQISAYAELAMLRAVRDVAKMSELVSRLPDLPESVRTQLLDHLATPGFQNLPEDQRFVVWESLDNLTRHHRKYSDSDWALEENSILQIENAMNSLAPRSPVLVCRPLFNGNDFNLYDEIGSYEDQQAKLDKTRQRAIESLLKHEGIESVVKLAQEVTEPYQVGRALGVVATNKHEAQLIPGYLKEENTILERFVSGFIWGRFWEKKWEWVDQLLSKKWTKTAKAEFLVRLPFEEKVWERVSTHLGDRNESKYWRQARVNPYGAKKELKIAIEKLLLHGRSNFSIHCIARTLHEDGAFDCKLAEAALLSALKDSEAISNLSQNDTVEIIKRLQIEESSDKDALFVIEWNFLPWLDRFSSGSPVILEKRLASDASFFAEVISHVYRSKNHEPSEERPDERTENLAQNGYKLLRDWRKCPGRRENGELDIDEFKLWMENALKLTKDSGHNEVAQSQIGQILTRAPSDPNGLWIHEIVADALNAKSASAMRSGFTIQIRNNRGVHGFSAGEEERKLAQENYEKAEKLELCGFTRFATAMRELGENYDRDAKRESIRDPYRA
jgi:hypothetical protein